MPSHSDRQSVAVVPVTRGISRRRPLVAAVLLGSAAVALAGCVTTTSSDPEFGKRRANAGAAGAAGGAALAPAGIAQSVGKSFKAGTDKVAAAFKPKPKEQLDGPVVEKPWWPFKKDDGGPGADFYVSLARVHEQGGSYDLAIAQYNKALAIDPDDAPALVGYAHVLDRQGHKVKATEFYLRAVKAHPDDASIANDLGLCYARQGKFEPAVKYLGKAVELQPDRELYRNNIATVLVELGRIDEAVTQVALVYGEPIARYNIGVLLSQRGQRAAAIEQFTAAVAKDPGLQEARQWLDQLKAEQQPREQLASAPAIETTSHTTENAAEARQPAVATQSAEPMIRIRAPARVATLPPKEQAPPTSATPQGAQSLLPPPPKVEAAPAPALPPSPSVSPPQAITLPESMPLPERSAGMRSLPAVDANYVPPSRY